MASPSSGEVSPLSITPSGTPVNGAAPKFGTLIPNRIFVGGIAANVSAETNEQELKQFFAAYGAVKDCKIIADRAGVSKGYGFITFETQEDAEKIIKKEAENLIFKDRKLNIGPAIRKQQAFPRIFEPGSMSPGAVFFANGVPYTFQNGVAMFHQDGSYAGLQQQAQQQQVAAAAAANYPSMMLPSAAAAQQNAAVYAAGYPQQAAYAYASPTAVAANTAAAANWTTAAQAAQWQRWAQQSQQQTAAAATIANGQYGMYQYAGYPQELLYAQTTAAGYGATELAEASLLEAAHAQAEGSAGMDPTLQQPQYVELQLPPTPQATQHDATSTTSQYAGPEQPTYKSASGISYGKRPAAPLVATPRKLVGFPSENSAYSPRATPPPAKMFQGQPPEHLNIPLTPPPTPEVASL